MAELKPCPFCGGEDIGIWESHSRFSSWSSSHFSQCNSCGATSDAFTTMEAATEVWNKRAEPERPRGRWEKSVEGYKICNHCKADVAIFSGHKNFCPNCGADMRGESDG